MRAFQPYASLERYIGRRLLAVLAALAPNRCCHCAERVAEYRPDEHGVRGRCGPRPRH